MNIQRSVDLLEKLPIRDLIHGRSVPFKLRPSQEIFTRKISEQYEESEMVRAIVLKSRRVGISSEADALLLLHCLAREQAHAKIVAHLNDTAEGLFRVPRDLAKALPVKVGDIFTKHIVVKHKGGDSILDIATAGSIGGGRGLTLSALHMSEAAKFPGEESFLSLLPAVSEGPDTMVIIESTAFGRVGPGKVFYEFWKSAVAGHNGYIPVFIGFLDDPVCVADPADADDAPATDLERELMAPPFNANKAQISWMRYTLENKCQGMLPRFSQEYPWTPEVAFVASGDPAFPPDEIKYVRECIVAPVAKGHLHWDADHPRFEKTTQGSMLLWEEPKTGHTYYIGADAAVGVEEGDFAAFTVIDGTVGAIVARYSERITPDILAQYLNVAGRWYNKAMLNVELTGNSGRETIRILRDQLMYPNFALWKGKDDKWGRKPSTLIGWETTTYSRRKLFDNFRTCIRGRMRGEEFPTLTVRDEACLEQLDQATLVESGRWEVEYGHDDILMSAMLAAIAYVQNPPPKVLGKRVWRDPFVMGSEDEQLREKLPKWQDDLEFSLQRHFKKVMSSSKGSSKPILGHGLEGI